MTYDLTQFIEHRFSKKESWLPPALLRWAQELEPETFHKELLHYAEKKLSLAPEPYDFYHTAITQHLDKNPPALTTIDAEGKRQEWTYEKLHNAVNYQVKRWNDSGLEAKQPVVIVAPLSAHFFIAYLTALRLGLTITYLPLEDPYISKTLLNEKIQEIQPLAVITTEELNLPEGSFQIIDLPDLPESKNNYTPTSTIYAPQETVQITLGTYDETFFPLRPLTAQNLYFSTMRDSVALLGLKPGQTFAAPLASSLYHPHILSTLFVGAHYLHIDPIFLKENPHYLAKEKIHTLGLTKPLQILWTENPHLPTSQLKFLYKTPFDQDYRGFKTFAAANKLEKVPIANLLIDNSHGGITLFSKPSLDFPDLFMLPNLNLPWELLDLNGSGVKSISSFGTLSINKTNTPLILVENHQEYILSDSRKPSRHGKLYPIEQVESALHNLAPFQGACLYDIIQGGTIANRTFILIIFTPSQDPDPDWNQLIYKVITEKVGPAYIPDHIEYYPLAPKIKNENVDRNWCEAQYSSGLLHKKREMEIYQKLSQLKIQVRG